MWKRSLLLAHSNRKLKTNADVRVSDWKEHVKSGVRGWKGMLA